MVCALWQVIHTLSYPGLGRHKTHPTNGLGRHKTHPEGSTHPPLGKLSTHRMDRRRAVASAHSASTIHDGGSVFSLRAGAIAAWVSVVTLTPQC